MGRGPARESFTEADASGLRGTGLMCHVQKAFAWHVEPRVDFYLGV